jgi:hypothetical protein
MRPTARLGNGHRPSLRMSRHKALQPTLVVGGSTPLRVGATDTTDAVSGPIAELNAGLLAQMKAACAVPFVTHFAGVTP